MNGKDAFYIIKGSCFHYIKPMSCGEMTALRKLEVNIKASDLILDKLVDEVKLGERNGHYYIRFYFDYNDQRLSLDFSITKEEHDILQEALNEKDKP